MPAVSTQTIKSVLKHTTYALASLLCIVGGGRVQMVSACAAGTTDTDPPSCLTQSDLDAVNRRLGHDPFFSPGDASCFDTGSPAAAKLLGSDNQEKAFNYFVSQGLTKEQAAGIIGNLVQESGVNPKEDNPKATHNAPDPSTVISSVHQWGGGIAQWEGGRWSGPSGLLSYVAGKGDYSTPQGDGKNWQDLGIQLNYMWIELTGVPDKNAKQPGLAEVKATSTATDAAVAFEKAYERAGDPQMDNRIRYAKNVLRLYGGNSVATDTSTNTTVSGGSSLCGNGDASLYVSSNGFVFFDQCNPDWGRYGVTSVCAAGCGPTSMAMIITNLTGKTVTPDVTSQYAAAHGQQMDSGGSFWTVAPVLAKHGGLHSQLVGASVTGINKILRAGGLIAAPGNGPVPYTQGGHYIVIRGVDANGNWLIGDSDQARSHKGDNTKAWNPQDIIPYMHAAGVYGITK